MSDQIESIELRNIIKDGLSVAYTSRSCKDGIATGNRYQSITLGDSELPGFRSSRSELFELFEFEGAGVLDIGSNLGELSRLTARQGAANVIGLEYDAYFVLLANLITLENGLSQRVRFQQGDVTKKFKFDQQWDYVLAFSVFTYMGHRLAEIAKATKKALIIETHHIEPGGQQKYLNSLKPHFPHIVVIGDSDWGMAEQFQDGKRLLIGCFTSRNGVWDFFSRCQSKGPKLSTRISVDLEQSNIPAFADLKKTGIPSLNDLSGIPDETPAHMALGLNEAKSLSHAAYWIDFLRGYEHMRSTSGEVTLENPYVRLLKSMIAAGNIFDHGAMKKMAENDEALLTRTKLRLLNFEKDIMPCVLFDVIGGKQNITLSDGKGESWSGTGIDGYHRMAAGLLTGRTIIPTYAFTVLGNP